MLKLRLSKFLPVLTVVLLVICVSTGYYYAKSVPSLASEAYPNSSRYTVDYGDSLFFIAREHGLTVMDIKQANALTSDMIIPGQVLTIPDKSSGAVQLQGSREKPLWQLINEKGLTSSGLKIVIDKSDHTLSLFSDGTWIKSYHVELGQGGMGDKEVAGDLKTPEGTFYISEKSVLNPPDYYLGSRWLRLSYPNAEDADRGLRLGLIERWTRDSIVAAFSAGKTTPQRTALGGGIGIHGGDKPEFGTDWTWGCIGMADGDIEDFYDYVNIGTQVIIKK